MKIALLMVVVAALVTQPYAAAIGQSTDVKEATQTPPTEPAKAATYDTAQPPSPEPPKAFAAMSGQVLEDGTPVKLRISRTVSSADAKTGDTVDFEVLEDVLVGKTIVIPKGGIAWATVTEAQSKRRMARGGKLDMNIDSVRLANGQKVPLRAVKEAKGGGHTGAMTGAMVGTAIVFFPAAPLFLFMHGKDITIPKGTGITAYINGNTSLDIASFAPTVTSPNAPVVTPASPTLAQATLDISSTPPGAEIELDGSFSGSTPSTVGVAVGEHIIRLTKSGFKPWERKIKTSTGNIRIAADMETVAPSGAQESEHN
jgi:hypothetical protein